MGRTGGRLDRLEKAFEPERKLDFRLSDYALGRLTDEELEEYEYALQDLIARGFTGLASIDDVAEEYRDTVEKVEALKDEASRVLGIPRTENTV